MPSMIRRDARGFSLVEMLVSIAVGLFLLAGVVMLFSATLSSQSNTLKTTRLNQELRNVIDLISRDVRRAGYWQLAYATGQPAGNITLSNTSGNVTITSSATPFSEIGAGLVNRTLITSAGAAIITGYVNPSKVNATVTRPFASTTINEGDWMISNLYTETGNDLVIAPDDTCVQYSYDRDGDATVADNERFAFRVSGGVVQMYPGTGTLPNCLTGAGNWENATSDVISIDELLFSDADTKCINTSDSDSDCKTVPPASGDVLMQIRQLNITLTGSLISNPATTRTFTEVVRLRNDRVYVF